MVPLQGVKVMGFSMNRRLVVVLVLVLDPMLSFKDEDDNDLGPNAH